MPHPTPVLIAPSILSADFAYLGDALKTLESAGADWIHVDVMDGHFVPNLTIGAPVVHALRKVTTLPLDVHLMIENPDALIPDFAKAGADILTVHVEACTHLHRTLQLIKSLGVKAGVSLNPHTPVSVLEPVIDDLDLILIMSVNPGFGGQAFIPYSLEKLKQAKALIGERRIHLEVDGGVGLTNIADILTAGADTIVAGSAIFNAPNMSETISQLRQGRQNR
ncbi:MAG: ribulose-phosphate 3-epimerase [Vampirovibrionales bacterium]|nr:ribulose-phosphate 3-epimerase [Vampirovibrionales bacterium]